MNERIRELAKLAGAHWNHGDFNMGSSVEFQEGDLQKLAELIVRECMDLASTEQKRYANITHRNMSECAVALGNFSLLLKDHFGVEE